MKISINARRIDGPWGGGNRFATNLERHLSGASHQVFRNLVPQLDVILLVAVQPKLEITSYTPDEAFDYRSLNPHTVVVLRVNTCDEQRAVDAGINRQVLKAAERADCTVFVSNFLRQLYSDQGFNTNRPNRVILTGADRDTFYARASRPWQPGERIRLVTHHWSTGIMKGFDFYERLDWLLDIEPYRSLFDFTYIGRMPTGLRLTRSRIVPPLDGQALADELRRHHVYVTGARHEPGGNHYIEAMQCGLPVVYLESGGNSEYCAGRGLAFTPTDFDRVLLQLPAVYTRLSREVGGLAYDSATMGRAYEQLFGELGSQIADRVRQRALWRQRVGCRVRLWTRRWRRRLRQRRRGREQVSRTAKPALQPCRRAA